MKKLCLLMVVMFVFTTCIFGNEWKVEHQLDKFGDETSNKILTTNGTGHFLNTVTTNSDLYYTMAVFKSNNLINLGLVEYSMYPVRNHDYEYVEMNLKSDDGVEHTLKIIFGTRSFIIDDDSYINLINLMKSNNNLKVYIKVDNSTYNFEINCTGFTKQYNALINQ